MVERSECINVGSMNHNLTLKATKKKYEVRSRSFTRCTTGGSARRIGLRLRLHVRLRVRLRVRLWLRLRLHVTLLSDIFAEAVSEVLRHSSVTVDL